MVEVEKLGKACKELMLGELRGKLKGTDNIFLSTFSGLNVAEQEKLRREITKSRASFYVTKNSICKRAFDELSIQELASLFSGLTGISYAVEDNIATCKALVGFRKDHENFKILGGYLEGKPVSVAEIEQLALLPSREVLLAKVVMAIKAPISGTVLALSGILRKLVYALKGICDKKPKEEKT